MKAKLRIKILQEATKAKNIKLVSNDISKSEAYKLRKDREAINNKIMFYKMINRIIERSGNK